MKKRIDLIKSETWLDNHYQPFNIMNDLLQQAIKDFVGKNDEIINIQMIRSKSGLNYFLIYIKANP